MKYLKLIILLFLYSLSSTSEVYGMCTDAFRDGGRLSGVAIDVVKSNLAKELAKEVSGFDELKLEVKNTSLDGGGFWAQFNQKETNGIDGVQVVYEGQVIATASYQIRGTSMLYDFKAAAKWEQHSFSSIPDTIFAAFPQVTRAPILQYSQAEMGRNSHDGYSTPLFDSLNKNVFSKEDIRRLSTRVVYGEHFKPDAEQDAFYKVPGDIAFNENLSFTPLSAVDLKEIRSKVIKSVVGSAQFAQRSNAGFANLRRIEISAGFYNFRDSLKITVDKGARSSEDSTEVIFHGAWEPDFPTLIKSIERDGTQKELDEQKLNDDFFESGSFRFPFFMQE